MCMILSENLQLLAAHCYQINLIVLKHYKMGNDILNSSKDDIFITTKKLHYEKSYQELPPSAFEKVFGKVEEKTLRKNQTEPCIQL